MNTLGEKLVGLPATARSTKRKTSVPRRSQRVLDDTVRVAETDPKRFAVYVGPDIYMEVVKRRGVLVANIEASGLVDAAAPHPSEMIRNILRKELGLEEAT